MLKKALSVCAALVLSAVVYAAAGPQVRSDHPDTYVVKKGDTLWGISGRFLRNPWYWPEIWQANPQIANPHLIYPGDVISLVYIDGKPRLVVNGEAPAAGPDIGPRVRDDGPTDAIPPLPLSAVREFLARPRVLTEEDYKAAPYLVAVEENRLRGAEGQLVYVRQIGDNVQPGQRFVVARPTLIYRDIPSGWFWNRKERKTVATSWEVSDQWHWSLREWFSSRSARVLGHELLEIGTANVSSGGDPGTVYVTYSDMEVREGDLLLPVEESPYELNFYPRPPRGVPENTRVLAFTDGLTSVGPMQVVVINKGAADGLEQGEVYSIYQEGDVKQDRVAYPEGSVREFVNPRKKNVKLPDEFIGHTMVFRTFDHVSYGLIMNGVRPVRLGALLREPTEL